jgi:hypothetical protein
MIPFFYQGLEKAHVPSAVNDEARSDLWDCDLIIAGITAEEAKQPEALWIYDEVEVAVRRGVPSFAYAHDANSHETGEKTFKEFIKGVPLIMVASPKSFGELLKRDLIKIQASLNER